ncbi:hypothetical protein KNP414_00283 [Paenibacillus mucilaginosus KNP414]|uniref:Uncharacterized protein n=1 Tax=Paenibacillus mucilaginosus (strain KNP414) TaxID=1036673 RepID=F8FMA0_PAEMK|nr:hypothetical protein KNP414_00283 [Paenibacillus mucilaginosus KNP414]
MQSGAGRRIYEKGRDGAVRQALIPGGSPMTAGLGEPG